MMKSTFWICGTLCFAALLSILSGMWFLIGGPYGTAYTLIALGMALFVAALLYTVSSVRKKKADRTPKAGGK